MAKITSWKDKLCTAMMRILLKPWLEIIKSEAGIKWDPDVVNALFEVLEH